MAWVPGLPGPLRVLEWAPPLGERAGVLVGVRLASRTTPVTVTDTGTWQFPQKVIQPALDQILKLAHKDLYL